MQPVMFNSNAPHAAVTPTVTAQPTAESATDAKPSVTQPADTAASNRSAAPQKEATLMEQQAQLKESAEKFNKMSEDLNLDVKFAYNDKIDQVYLNVIDKHTGRVIRKLPSEEAMKISESMKELVGALLDKRG